MEFSPTRYSVKIIKEGFLSTGKGENSLNCLLSFELPQHTRNIDLVLISILFCLSTGVTQVII